jgi:hypothetical protein
LQGIDDQSGKFMHCIAYKIVTVVVAHTTKGHFQIKENEKVTYMLTL